MIIIFKAYIIIKIQSRKTAISRSEAGSFMYEPVTALAKLTCVCISKEIVNDGRDIVFIIYR